MWNGEDATSPAPAASTAPALAALTELAISPEPASSPAPAASPALPRKPGPSAKTAKRRAKAAAQQKRELLTKVTLDKIERERLEGDLRAVRNRTRKLFQELHSDRLTLRENVEGHLNELKDELNDLDSDARREGGLDPAATNALFEELRALLDSDNESTDEDQVEEQLVDDAELVDLSLAEMKLEIKRNDKTVSALQARNTRSKKRLERSRSILEALEDPAVAMARQAEAAEEARKADEKRRRADAEKERAADERRRELEAAKAHADRIAEEVREPQLGRTGPRSPDLSRCRPLPTSRPPQLTS
jgi:hypothetical protein